MGKLRRARAHHPKKYCPVDAFACFMLNEKGQGVVEWNGKTYTVDELLPGEKAYVVVYYEDNTTGDARAIKLIEESPARSLPLGAPKMQLGSYHLAHMKERDQDAWKQAQVTKLFSKAEPIKVGQRTFYRNKVVLHDGGFMPSGRNRKHAVIPRPEQFDLMAIDFSKYKDTKGDIIIRRLDEEIEGRPGDQKKVMHTFMGKRFSVNLNSFYQVNNEMAECAYRDIMRFVPHDSVVFDLFAGAATIGIHVADRAKEVYSVEISKQAHDDALQNIKLNTITNVRAICADANAFVITTKIKSDVIIVDPARSGLNEHSITAINNSQTKRIIYLACDIRTQARDIEGLTNYQIKHVQPYDFFPQTYHIENLVVLDRKVVSGKAHPSKEQ